MRPTIQRLPENAAPLDPRLAVLGLTGHVILAPMAGITDLPFRRIVRSYGAGFVVSEMVASREMVQAKRSVRDRAELGAQVIGTAVQIAGRDAYWMGEAAKVVAGQGARMIDINMGCPAKKVTGGLSGSALLRDHDHALRLIEAVVAAVDVPVTLKTRLGWDDTRRDTRSLAIRAEAAGIRLLTIHGRTRCQFYNGQADWAAIAEIVDAVAIPVLANGDIVDADAARTALRLSGAAGVMVGRGAQGAPWRLAEIAAALGHGPTPQIPQGPALADLVRDHLEASLAFYGPVLGARVIRKHLGWYMDRAGTPRALRGTILRGSPDTVRANLVAAVACQGARAA